MQTERAFNCAEACGPVMPAARSRKVALLGSIAMFAVVALGLPANAGSIDDCNQVRNLDRQLRGCTAYIKSGAGTAENTAVAHLNRANIYARRGKLDLALADYAAALRLDPKNSLIPYNRGNVYFDNKQYERAIADYT